MLTLNLKLFDGAAGAAATEGQTSAGKSSTAGANNGSISGAVHTDNGTSDKADKAAKYKELISGEYKDEHNAYVQNLIRQRFKDSDKIKTANASMKKAMQAAAEKYGLNPDDYEGIAKAISTDDAYVEKASKEEGLTPEQFKEIKKLRAESQQLQSIRSEEARRNDFDAKLQAWQAESESVKQIYPGFELKTEFQNKDFVSLLRSGIDVKTAYEVIHKDEIIGGAMAYTAQQVRQNTVDGIRSKGARPVEGAAGEEPGSVNKIDVHKLTKEQRADYIRRAASGEKISF